MQPLDAQARRLILAGALALAALGGSVASAQTLRWASQGDPATMDPHAMNEGLTNMVNAKSMKA